MSRHSLLFFLLFLSFSLSAQTFQISTHRDNPLGSTDIGYGTSVWMFQKMIAVGAPNYQSEGAVYFYQFSLPYDQFLTDYGQLVNPLGTDDHFGYQVVHNFAYVTISAPFADSSGKTDCGLVYLYKNIGNGNYQILDTMAPPVLQSSAKYGYKLFLSGDYLFVGEPYHSFGTTVFVGEVHVYKWNSSTERWDYLTAITNPDNDDYAYFGVEIYFNDPYLIIGASHASTSLGDAGKAYIFKKDASDNFTHLATLYDGAASTQIGYGSSTYINDTMAIVSAPYFDNSIYVKGKVYIYFKDKTDETNWQLNSALTDDLQCPCDGNFGYKVTFFQDTLLITEPNLCGSGGPSTFYGLLNFYQYSPSQGWTVIDGGYLSDDIDRGKLGEAVSHEGNHLIASAAAAENVQGRFYLLTRYPVISSQPQSITNVCIHDTIYFNVTSHNAKWYQWKVSTDGGSSYTNLSDGNDYSGTTSSTLYINNPDSQKVGYKYKCVVSNILGSIESNAVDYTLDKIAPDFSLKTTQTFYLDSSGIAVIDASKLVYNVNENCQVIDTIVSPDTMYCNETGTRSVGITLVDPTGNQTTRYTTVQIQDTLLPYFDFHSYDVYLGNDGTAQVVADSLIYNVWDNCKIVDTTLDRSTVNCDDLDQAPDIIVTVKDPSGNTYSQAITVYVHDTIKPTGIAHDTTIALDSSGIASITANEIATDVSDNCASKGVSMDLAKQTFNAQDLGTVNDTLKLYDYSINQTLIPFTVTVIDTIKPAIFVSNDTLYLDANGEAYLNPHSIIDSTWDNTGIVDTSFSKTHFTCADVNTTTDVIVTITDLAGNTKSATTKITVLDNIKPNLTVKSEDYVLLDSSGQASISPDDVVISASDNCSVVDTALSQYNFDCTLTGTWTIDVTVTDQSGNTFSQPVDISVCDSLLPYAHTIDPDIYLDSSGQAHLYCSQVQDSLWDNCQIIDTTLSKTDFSYSDLGTKTVYFSITDESLNKISYMIFVHVLDTIKPAVWVNDDTLYLDGNGEAYLNPLAIIDSTWDNVGVADTSFSQTQFTCANAGLTINDTLTITDLAGNKTTKIIHILVLDTIIPDLVVKNPGYLLLDYSGQANISDQDVVMSASDNCPLIDTTLSQYNFNCSEIGTHTIDVTVTDNSGNTNTQQINLSVYDSIPPEADPMYKDIYLDENGHVHLYASQVLNYLWDNCQIIDTSFSQADFDCSDIGSHQLTLTVTDQSLNKATYSVNINVEDTIKPQLTCHDTLIVIQGSSYVVQDSSLDPGFWDNCTMTLDSLYNNLSNSPTLYGETLPIGTHQVIWTYTDESDNSTECTSTIEITKSTDISSFDTRIKIYPNPAKDILTLEINDNTVKKLIIKDIIGNTIFSQTLKSDREIINIEALPPAVYFIEVITPQTHYRTKFIKE